MKKNKVLIIVFFLMLSFLFVVDASIIGDVEYRSSGSALWTECAGLYDSNNQGVGIYIKNYNGAQTYFVMNSDFSTNSTNPSSKDGSTTILYTIYHFDITRASRFSLPSEVIVLGTPTDLKKVSNGT